MKDYDIIVRTIDGSTTVFSISSTKTHKELLEECSPVSSNGMLSWVTLSTDERAITFNSSNIVSITVE